MQQEDREWTAALAAVLTANLGLTRGERLAVVADTRPFAAPLSTAPNRPALAAGLAAAAAELGAAATVVTFDPTGRSGAEPPEAAYAAVYPPGFVAYAQSVGLWQPLQTKTISAEGLARLADWLKAREPAIDVLLAITGYSLTHTHFRKLLSASGHVRAATMPGVEPAMFQGVMTADWPRVAARSQHVATLLSQATAAHVTTPGGHVLEFGLAGRAGLADTGVLTAPGAFGNLPGGEAFIAPVEGTAQGSVAVGGRENPSAAYFRFADGRLVAVEGEFRGRESLLATLQEFDAARNLAELGVGTNEKATAPDNILEAEKILGTIHLALGDNAGFGGAVSVPFHQDYVIYRPTLRLHMPNGDDVMVVADGRFVAEPD